MRRVTMLLVAALLVVSIVPSTTFADDPVPRKSPLDGTGDGSITVPDRPMTSAELAALKQKEQVAARVGELLADKRARRISGQQLAEKLRQLRREVTGSDGDVGVTSAWYELGVYGVLQSRDGTTYCNNYCGPASTYAILKYQGKSYAQAQIADNEGTGPCGSYGTCFGRIQDTLNGWGTQTYARYNPASSSDYVNHLVLDLSVYSMAIENIVRPWVNADVHLDKYTSAYTSGHYVVSRGYQDVYGPYLSYSDSVRDGTVDTVGQHWWDPNTFYQCLAAQSTGNGTDGCGAWYHCLW
ncbi:MAG: C39 family peptidase [Chloroflexota bacterium]